MAYPKDLFYGPTERRLGCADLEPSRVSWLSLPPADIAGDVDRLHQTCSLGSCLVYKHVRVAAFNSGYIVGDNHISIAHQLHDKK